ncbi:glycine betaine ABC transporter substrate-binding protein [Leucobacter muris]|jgi:glycine betaine/proline transport system substrate-binding protein|uniref:Glycine betaine ABC transporter substrate-binding protein n=1 Tax=Leucobacter muris TaxID=1935379 RepID=A0ABX5QFW1_9MICO|nr:glycine betaine ABC transporter substrate-binding protein [Leucobacter muris]QAB17865.1 glycine betaine ABC transporter substrate-binding protein [Leucobacter muris]
MIKRKLTGILALGAAASLALVGCSSDGGSANGDGGDKGTVTLGFLPSWTDGLSTAYLLENQLEKLGYDVEMEELTEAAVLYTGLANGDIDVYPSAWSEKTHATYMEQYGDQLEDLGAYYDNAVLTIAVPEYMDDVNSIEDLVGQADRFDGEIIGIEPSAGLTEQTETVMMPEYGLDGDYSLVTSSTATMLATLQEKIDNEEDVVVTLWRPFWANDAFPVKDLEDPKGAMGEPEALHFLATGGFSEQYPEAAELIESIQLDDAAYGSLEALVTGDEYEGDPEGAVEAWLAEHPDAFPGLIAD